MNRTLIICFLLISFIGISQSFEKIQNADSLKNKLSQKFKSNKSISAAFEETVYSSMLTEPKKAYGELKYTKSNKLRWEHKKPVSKILLVQDGNLRMFENGVEQKNTAKNRIVNQVKNIMMQLFNGEFLNGNDFIIGYYESSDQYKLKLAPRSKRIAKHMKYLELIFDKKELFLKKITLYDTEEDKIVYSFSSVKFGMIFPENTFTTQ